MRPAAPRERLAAAEQRLARIGVDIARSQQIGRAGLRRVPPWLLLGSGVAVGAVVGRIASPLPGLFPLARTALRWGLTLASLASASDAANDAEPAQPDSGHGE